MNEIGNNDYVNYLKFLAGCHCETRQQKLVCFEASCSCCKYYSPHRASLKLPKKKL